MARKDGGFVGIVEGMAGLWRVKSLGPWGDLVHSQTPPYPPHPPYSPLSQLNKRKKNVRHN
jgi:hypothetical protein